MNGEVFIQNKDLGETLIQVKDLKKCYPIRTGLFGGASGQVRAVDGVSFSIGRGTTMGLVGESGCGKSTLGKTLLRLTQKTAGEAFFCGIDLFSLSRKELREIRPKLQIVFQDPYASLSPRMPIGEIIGEAVREHEIVPKREQDGYISQVMRACGLAPDQKDRYAHEFSGGQRQRISIARALALKPEFIVCDEPVSALDVSIQAQIINLLVDLQREFALTYLFISHDLSLVEHIASTVGVMYLGQIVEFGAKADVFANPLHPYTQALFSAIPVPDPRVKRERILLRGSVPSPANPPFGCRFHTRCAKCMDKCKTQVPKRVLLENGHEVLCHLYGEST
jgi:peptide/nickel transport system ATP-binding protein